MSKQIIIRQTNKKNFPQTHFKRKGRTIKMRERSQNKMHQYLDLHALGKLFSTYKLNARYETKNHYQRTTLKSLKRTQT